MKYTIIHNSGGYHGHQLKDYFGGIAIGKILGFEYLHTPYRYLSFFGLGYGEKTLQKWERYAFYFRSKKVSGPAWDGYENYGDFRDNIARKLETHQTSLLIFEKALRVHPHQTISWYRKGQIDRNIFDEIVGETTKKFRESHELHPDKKAGPVKVVMHISRGVDFDHQLFPEHFESSFNVRYMFSMEYFLNIYFQIKQKFGEDFMLDIYTELLNSEDIIQAFEKRKNVNIHIGSNRQDQNNNSIEKIFKEFVTADILVTCNSSFSTAAIYFRDGLKTIYHPHLHMYGLEGKNHIATDVQGHFDHSLL